jgi:hypothetical protein
MKTKYFFLALSLLTATLFLGCYGIPEMQNAEAELTRERAALLRTYNGLMASGDPVKIEAAGKMEKFMLFTIQSHDNTTSQGGTADVDKDINVYNNNYGVPSASTSNCQTQNTRPPLSAIPTTYNNGIDYFLDEDRDASGNKLFKHPISAGEAVTFATDQGARKIFIDCWR